MTLPTEPMLELEHITKIYKTAARFLQGDVREVIALNRVSFRIQKGEIFGLVGESGSGKTTVGRLVVNLEDPEEGKILLKGKNILGLKGSLLKRYRKTVQMIFQDPYQSLNPQISVLNTVCEPLIIHHLGDAIQRREMILSTLDAVGLSPAETFIHRYPHQLSGGQRQRVAIARAIILNPELVVADEPTSMLDASISAHIFNILIELRDKRDITFIFITHNLAAARYLCDRMAVIYKGNLVELGLTEDIIQNPKHPYTQALLDALPKFRSRGDIPRYHTLLDVIRNQTGVQGCAFFPRCRKADDIKCRRESPSLVELAPSHQVACFYA